MPPAFPTLINRFKPIMSYVLLLFFFWLMFIAIPRKQVSLRNAFFGAALASAGWVLFSFIFSVFVENFANYATIYGSLAALVILWYGCMPACLFCSSAARSPCGCSTAASTAMFPT